MHTKIKGHIIYIYIYTYLYLYSFFLAGFIRHVLQRGVELFCVCVFMIHFNGGLLLI